MSERLHFDLLPAQSAGHRLAIEVPRTLMESIYGDNEASENLAILTRKKHRAVLIESGGDSDVLLFNDKRIGDATNKLALLRHALWQITDLDKRATTAQKDPVFQASMGRNAHMTIAWPQLEGFQITQTAGRYMPEIARKLHYSYPDICYAYADRHRGVSLHANDVESKSFETSKADFNPAARTFEVVAQGDYGPMEKFICLIGGVAIARANTLASS